MRSAMLLVRYAMLRHENIVLSHSNTSSGHKPMMMSLSLKLSEIHHDAVYRTRRPYVMSQRMAPQYGQTKTNRGGSHSISSRSLMPSHARSSLFAPRRVAHIHAVSAVTRGARSSLFAPRRVARGVSHEVLPAPSDSCICEQEKAVREIKKTNNAVSREVHSLFQSFANQLDEGLSNIDSAWGFDLSRFIRRGCSGNRV